jgi:Ca2+-binding EF-hand superfamily protein
MAEDTPLTEDQLNEFVTSMMTFIMDGDESVLESMFTVMDRNGDGTVSRTELRTVMAGVAASAGETITEEQVDAALIEADTNKDQRIQKSEFIAVMKARPKMV